MSRIRLTPEDRKVAIVLAAMRVAARSPTKPLRRGDVAKEAGCCPSLITHYFTNMSALEQSAVLNAIVTISAISGPEAYAMHAMGINHGINDHGLRGAAAAHLAGGA